MIQFFISGTTLVWVAILVIIVVYNFALTAFALFRSTLDPYGELPFFGYNLFQTFIVILRYGIIGELYEVKRTQCASLHHSTILLETEDVKGRFYAIHTERKRTRNQNRSKNNRKRSKKIFQTSKEIFAFEFAFAWYIHTG